jgi:hypothetical protein
MISIPVFKRYKTRPQFLLCIQRGNEWKVEAKMTEAKARELASECRMRGLDATVKEIA